jgi:hypothetical protein
MLVLGHLRVVHLHAGRIVVLRLVRARRRL